MRFVAILSTILSCFAGQVVAENHMGCDKEQVQVITHAIRSAKDLTLKAATTVADTPEYARWFGPYSDANAEVVRGNLKAVISAIRSGAVTTQCDLIAGDGCDAGEYAWVYPHRPYEVHLCPPFFNLPPLTALQPGERRSDNGTREGTIVHEISHFIRVADTEDHCYSRRECMAMASDDAALAIDNADSYQYFTEDVTYYARQPISGKPPLAARRN